MSLCQRIVQRACILAIVLAGLTGCRSSSPEAALQSLYSTATVERGTMADVVNMAGQVIAPTSRTLTFSSFGGRVLEVFVTTGQPVSEGQELMRLETTAVERELREAQADLRAAEAELAEAERTASEAEMAKAQAELAMAEAELAEAQLALKVTQQAPLAALEEAVAESASALQTAKDQYRIAELSSHNATIRELEYDLSFFQRSLRDEKKPAKRAEMEKLVAELQVSLDAERAARADALRAAEAAVAKAEEDLADDEAALAQAQSGVSDPTAQARLDYERAAARVDRAKKALADLQAGNDSAAVSAARTTYEAALARVEGAEAALAESTLTAPFAGVVFAVYANPGDDVQPGAPALYIADPADLRIQAQASEMDIARLSEGQAVRIEFYSYSDLLFEGEVLTLPARGQESGGMSFFPIEVSVAPGEADVRPGMGANVRVVVGEKADVLMVPAAALQYQPPDRYFVQVRTADGRTQQREIEVGLDDGIMVEVIEGLSEGETVVIPLRSPTEPNQGMYGMMY